MTYRKGKYLRNTFIFLLIILSSLSNQAFITINDHPRASNARGSFFSEQTAVILKRLDLIAAKPLADEKNEPLSLFRWALAWWKDSNIACNIYTEATGEPSSEIIQGNCGDDILKNLAEYSRMRAQLQEGN